jgi:hypothetical protein
MSLRSQTSKNKNNKETKKRFPWGKHEQTLKDIVLKNKTDFLDPTPEDFVKIANELATTYKVEDITGDTVRWKFRTQTFKKWLRKQGSTSENKKRKRESSSSESASSDDYSSDSFSDSSTSSGHDAPISILPGRGYASQPGFWIISDSDCSWYFMRRKWKIEAKHFAGKQYIDIEYQITPPTVFELQNLLKKSKQPSLKSLDINKPNIQNQIKEWKPITWKVALNTPLPLIPSLYNAAREDEYSWIQVPRNNPTRSTVFGDDEVDIDYVNDVPKTNPT